MLFFPHVCRIGAASASGFVGCFLVGIVVRGGSWVLPKTTALDRLLLDAGFILSQLD